MDGIEATIWASQSTGHTVDRATPPQSRHATARQTA
jgi:hypothetical protein